MFNLHAKTTIIAGLLCLAFVTVPMTALAQATSDKSPVVDGPNKITATPKTSPTDSTIAPGTTAGSASTKPTDSTTDISWETPPDSETSTPDTGTPPPTPNPESLSINGIPPTLRAYNNVGGASVSILFNPDGSYTYGKSGGSGGTGRWLDGSTDGSKYEIKVTSHTTWARASDGGLGDPMGGGMGGGPQQMSDDADTGWLPLSTKVTLSMSDSGCRGTDITGEVFSQPTITIRSKSDSSKTVQVSVNMSACGSCFAQGTQVKTWDGKWVPIEEVKMGDKLKSFVSAGTDFTQGDVESIRINSKGSISFVAGTVTGSHAFYKKGGISVNGIKSTSEHLYFIHSSGAYHFVQANNIDLGMHLVGANKDDLGILALQTFTERTQFVSLSVDVGTFIVRKGPGAPAVLVHNLSRGGGGYSSPFRVY